MACGGDWRPGNRRILQLAHGPGVLWQVSKASRPGHAAAVFDGSNCRPSFSDYSVDVPDRSAHSLAVAIALSGLARLFGADLITDPHAGNLRCKIHGFARVCLDFYRRHESAP